jgi:hypothetical protein
MDLLKEYQDALKSNKITEINFNNCEQELNDSVCYKLKGEELHLGYLLKELKKKSKKELFEAVPVEKTFLEKFMERLYHLRGIKAND